MNRLPRYEAAKEVAEFLVSIGQNKRANDVLAIARSYVSSRTTNSQLHKHNVELRRKLGLAETGSSVSNVDAATKQRPVNLESACFLERFTRDDGSTGLRVVSQGETTDAR